jgi:hypothetical protein
VPGLSWLAASGLHQRRALLRRLPIRSDIAIPDRLTLARNLNVAYLTSCETRRLSCSMICCQTRVMEGVTMLSEIRRSGSLRLLYGVVPVTILIAVLSPVTASASTQDTYANLAKAISLRNWRTDYSVKFQLRQSSASVINADDSAVALTSGCHDCGAIAVAFQVIFALAQSLTILNVNGTAEATSNACVRCSTLAEAVQLVDISNTQQRLTWKQRAGLEHVRSELEELRYSRLSTDQIQSEVAELANQAVALFQNSTGDAPASEPPLVSPAINGSALLGPLTGISQPGIELFIKTQSA